VQSTRNSLSQCPTRTTSAANLRKSRRNFDTFDFYCNINGLLAEGEELGSNLLHVDYRSSKQPIVSAASNPPRSGVGSRGPIKVAGPNTAAIDRAFVLSSCQNPAIPMDYADRPFGSADDRVREGHSAIRREQAMNKFREFTRQQLYELVWSTPMVKLAKEFGLSDVGLRKTCVKHGIPTPPLGYWAKLNFGRPVEKTPLGPPGAWRERPRLGLDVYVR